MLLTRALTGSLIVCFSSFAVAQTTAKRTFSLDDLSSIQDVSDPEVSPEGKWVAYTVSTVDKEGDKRQTDVWMVSWDGTQKVQLTNSPEPESSPRWSPDGQYLSFLSSRPGKAKGDQVWIMDRRGGDARQLTEVKEKISDYAWSPDSKKLLLQMREPDEPVPDPKSTAPPPPPKPIVIDRYHFKADESGYLSGSKFGRLYLFDIATKKTELLTTFGKHDEENAEWSPDGTKIAFISNQEDDPARTESSDVYVVDAHANASPRKLTSFVGFNGGHPAWSPDSKLIAYLQGTEPKFSAYSQNRLAVVPADSGSPRLLTEELDRGVSDPAFTADGKSIVVIVSDDRSAYLSKVALSGKSIERLVAGPIAITAQSRKGTHAAVLTSMDNSLPEVFALDGASLRKLTAHNDALLSGMRLAGVEEINFKSKDGTEIHGLITKPPQFESGKKYPTLLRIHGGPNAQEEHAFSTEHQILAAHGYVVISLNYRGSSGRGRKFSESIFADWGDKEVADLLAGVDHVIGMGIADPDRLGIGGWSYGGILTDYTIASDSRFKAAISGAGSANQISMYGADQYVFQYDQEIGPPWKSPEAWVKISYPFFQANRIRTPTLFLGGDLDFNVPLIGGEQMYQALRTLGVPTELIIYPGQHHSIARPSFQRDRLERYIAWYDKYLKPTATTQTANAAIQ